MELGLKARVFIYYLQNTEKGKSTNKFSIDFLNENEKFAYIKKAEFQLREKHLEKEKSYIDWEDEEDVAEYEEMYKTYEVPKWMVIAEAKILLEKDADEARNWLIENGYLFKNDYSKFNGKMTVHYTGVTDKGWKVSPMYLKLVKEN
mgnify:CR=1 FL=1